MSSAAILDPKVLYFLPALPPPPGVKSNFTSPVTNASTIVILNGLFLGLAVVFVAVRIYIRTTLPQGQKLGWDDGTCVLALISSTVHTVLLYVVLDIGYGRHLWDLRATSMNHANLTRLTGVDIVYTVAIYLVKLSILLLYQRLFSVYDTSRRMITAGHVMIAIIMIMSLCNTIARISICTSVLKAMGIAFCSGRNVNIVIITAAVLNAFADFYILVIPAHRVLKMQITRRKKLGLLIIFLGGLIACSMSIIRLAMATTRLDSPDVLWNASRVTPFTIVEMNLGIMCSCMMFTPSFFKKGKIAAHSMKSFLGSGHRASDKSIVKVNSNDSNERVESKAKTVNVQNTMEVWEHDLPDLELMTDEGAKGHK